MTQRPSVQLRTENRSDEYRAHLEKMLPGLQALPGVVGITLNGGLSRGYADHLSEIDVTLYLDSDTFAVWQQGRAPITTGITMLDRLLYDIKYVDLAAERMRRFESMELWDLSYAQILFDPSGEVASLIADKLARQPQAHEASGLMFSVWWYFRLAGDIWIHRGDTLQGHLMLNHAVEALLKALFVANGEYIPHEKWLVHLSRSLEWTPVNWESRLFQAMCVADESVAALCERQSVIEQLWLEIDQYIVKEHCPGFPLRLMQKDFYDLLALLVERESLSVAEWQTKASLVLLNNAPFHDMIVVEGDTLRLDRDRLLDAGPEMMYSWHYEVLDAARSHIQRG